MRTVRPRLAALMSLLTFLTLLSACTSAAGSNAEPTTTNASTRTSETGTRIQADYGAYTNLKPAELKQMLDRKDFFLVDTHVPPEGRLPKTDARIPFDKIEQRINEFPADKNAKMVLACRSGRMSSEASQTLVKLGYKNVYNLEGGMIAWKKAGYEIIPEGK